MGDGKETGQYSIEARSLGIGGLASHNFLVLRDEKGHALAELHGLATDRKSGQGIAIGTDESLHSLRVWHFAHDADYAKSIDTKADGSTFIAGGQDHRTVLIADKQEILERWNAAVAAKKPLNALDLNYPNYGFKMSGDTVNSNSAYRTLSEIMGVSVHDFPGKLEPGLDNRMVGQKDIEALQTHGFPVLNKPAIKEHGEYHPLYLSPTPSPGPSPAAFEQGRLQGSTAQGDGSVQYDARSPSHPGHADYARIREGLAGNVGDARALDNVAASAYREMAANPQLKQIDYVGVHNGNAIVAYAPNGLGREPMFNAHVDIAQARQQPAEDSLERAQALTENRALAQTQAQSSHGQTQGAQPPSHGARTA